MSVLDRSALVDSPLADLHALAAELSIDGYRRLRRDDLIDAILDKQGGDAGDAEPSGDDDSAARRRRGRRGGRGRGSARDADGESDATSDAESDADTADSDADSETEEVPSRPRRSRSRSRAKASESDADSATDDESAATPARGRRGRGRKAADDEPAAEEKPSRGRGARADRSEKSDRSDRADEGGDGDATEDELVTGVVELLPNGSGFVRVAGPDPTDDDVYISAAQVKRCELVSGDTIAGPKRAPRRSERFASLVRVETINGRPASELADSVRFDDLPAAFPDDRLKVGSDDPTLKAIEWLTPFGRGSRVAITGASRAGKSEALRRLAGALAEREELTLSVALAGVRPEELADWTEALAPAAAVTLGASEDAQFAALEPVVDQARRLAARGADAVVVIDSLDGLSAHQARRLMASARNVVDGGSVTIVAAATVPVGGETTVIALDVALTSVGRFPALDLVASGTVRPELLVGEAGAEAIARTRAEVSDTDE